MKRVFLTAIFIFFLAFPIYSYTLLCGKQMSLQDILQAASDEILFFYSTRCPYCSQEIKLLNDNCDYLKEQGYKVFFVALPDSKRRLEHYKELLKLKCPIILDDGSLASLYDIIGVPTYIFLYKGKPFGVAHSMDLEAIEDVYRQQKN